MSTSDTVPINRTRWRAVLKLSVALVLVGALVAFLKSGVDQVREAAARSLSA